MKKTFQRYKKEEGGVAAVEFALISGALLISLFGTIEFGRGYWTWSAMQYAVEETSRYALTHSDATDEDLEAYAIVKMEDVGPSAEGFNLSFDRPVISDITFIQINATYQFTSMIPFLPDGVGEIGLTASTKLPIPTP